MYKTLITFQDGENGNHFNDNKGVVYQAGDTYPAKGIEVSENHINYLLGDENKLGSPVIEVVNQEEKPVSKMNIDELKEYAQTNGIDLAGATTKKDILWVISSFGAGGVPDENNEENGDQGGE